jgi:hypothetical protein
MLIIKSINLVLLLLATLYVSKPVIENHKIKNIPFIELEILRINCAILICSLYFNAYDLLKDLGYLYTLLSISICWTLVVVNFYLLTRNRDKLIKNDIK